jgi:hypothetical protein
MKNKDEKQVMQRQSTNGRERVKAESKEGEYG